MVTMEDAFPPFTLPDHDVNDDFDEEQVMKHIIVNLLNIKIEQQAVQRRSETFKVLSQNGGLESMDICYWSDAMIYDLRYDPHNRANPSVTDYIGITSLVAESLILIKNFFNMHEKMPTYSQIMKIRRIDYLEWAREERHPQKA